MDVEFWEMSDNEDGCRDSASLQNRFTLNDGKIDLIDMTSLGQLLLIEHSITKEKQALGDATDDFHLNRLSLAYEKLHTMPKIFLNDLPLSIQILDLSNNEFENLDFLVEFKELTSLICDHNNITSNTTLPFMPKLELLWMNRCKIVELYPWAKKLQQSCPNLKYLSLMGNQCAPSYLNGGNFYDYLQYRLFMISLFPKLIHLDDRSVTEDQREEAKKVYRRPLLGKITSMANDKLPLFLRTVSSRFSEIMTPTPSFASAKRNVIV